MEVLKIAKGNTGYKPKRTNPGGALDERGKTD